jgi:hypothetical protein
LNLQNAWCFHLQLYTHRQAHPTTLPAAR